MLFAVSYQGFIEVCPHSSSHPDVLLITLDSLISCPPCSPPTKRSRPYLALILWDAILSNSHYMMQKEWCKLVENWWRYSRTCVLRLIWQALHVVTMHIWCILRHSDHIFVSTWANDMILFAHRVEHVALLYLSLWEQIILWIYC